MRVVIARGAKAVSAEGLRAAIAVTPAGAPERSGGAKKLKGPPQVDNYHFFSFFVSLPELTKTSFSNRIGIPAALSVDSPVTCRRRQKLA